MNWTGGARNRFRRVKNDRKRQEEFFERQKLANRAKTAAPISTPAQHKKGISRDIIHLQCVKETKRSAVPTETARVAHASPDEEIHFTRDRAVNRVDLLRGRSNYSLGQGGRSKSRRRERLHLPNASPCKQTSMIDLADASDAEHADPRPFRHLPSYQSTPLDEFTRQRFNYHIGATQSRRRDDKAMSRILNPPPSNHALTMPTLSQNKSSERNKSLSCLDETLRACDFLNCPETSVPKSERRVNFSHTNEYHSVSDESLGDQYSVFESFLHNEGKHFPSPITFDDVINNNVCTSTASSVITSVGTHEPVFAQTSVLGCPMPTRDFIMSPYVQMDRSNKIVEVLPRLDFTPIKKKINASWEREFCERRLEIQTPERNFGSGIGNHSEFHRVDQAGPKSLTSSVCPKTQIFDAQDEIETSLSVTPSVEKTHLKENPQTSKSNNLKHILNYGTSGDVILSQDEHIPGMELSAWERIKIGKNYPKIEERALVALKPHENSEFPFTINKEDGLPLLSDTEVEITSSSEDLVAVCADGNGVEAEPQIEPGRHKAEAENFAASTEMEVGDILSKAAEKLSQLPKKVGDSQELVDVRPRDADSLTRNRSSNLDREEPCVSAKIFFDKACSPIQAIFPRIRADIGVQTSPFPGLLDSPTQTTAGTQTDSADFSHNAVSAPANIPFVLLGDRVSSEIDDVTTARKRSSESSQSSSDDSLKEEEKSSRERRRSKRLKNLTQN